MHCRQAQGNGKKKMGTKPNLIPSRISKPISNLFYRYHLDIDVFRNKEKLLPWKPLTTLFSPFVITSWPLDSPWSTIIGPPFVDSLGMLGLQSFIVEWLNISNSRWTFSASTTCINVQIEDLAILLTILPFLLQAPLCSTEYCWLVYNGYMEV